MKNLDINPSSANYSDERSRQVVIEFTGGIHSKMMQRGTHTMKVPYSSFSKKLQTIHRLGGKIINVSIPCFQLDRAKIDSEKVDFIPVEPISENIVEKTIPIIQKVEPLESTVPLSKQKKAKPSPKSNHGFNKPKR